MANLIFHHAKIPKNLQAITFLTNRLIKLNQSKYYRTGDFVLTQVRNKDSGLCLDTMGKDEKMVFNVGLFYCQNGASANEVSHILEITDILPLCEYCILEKN